MAKIALLFAALTTLAVGVIGNVIPLTEDCIKGVTFEGTPKGKHRYNNASTKIAQNFRCIGKNHTINGVKTYVAIAKTPRKADRALLLLTGTFSHSYTANENSVR